MKYNAFISYSHRQDSKLAPCLETALEKFAKPTFKRRALEIFRDSNNLSASPDLWGKIEEGLDGSEYFIFLASPTAAQSRWCKKEVDHWLKTKSIDQFLVVITEGELVWDEEASDFDWTKTTALPRNLSGAFKNDPLYIDFRGDPPEEELTLDHPEFKDKLVHLAATIHGMAVGDMVGEAVKQHKRTMRIRNAAIIALSTLLVAAVLLSIYATHQKNVAESETRKALLSNYISGSQAQLAENPTKSLRLAEYAYRFAKKNELPTKEAAEQLIKVFYSGYGFYQQPGKESAGPAVNTEEQSNDEVFALFRQKTTDIINTVHPDPYLGGPVTAIHIDVRSNQAEFLVAGGTLDFPRLYYFSDLANASERTDDIEIKLEGFGGFTGYIQAVAIASDGRYSLLGSANSKTALIDNEAYRRDANNADVFKTRYVLISGEKNAIFDVGFTEGGQYCITRSYKEIWKDSEQSKITGIVTHLWKTEPFPYIEMHNTSGEHHNISISGGYYMVPVAGGQDEFTWFHYAQIIRDKQDVVVAEFPDAKGVSPKITTSPNGKFSANYQGIFNNEKELLITLSSYFIDNPGIAYCFSSDGNFLKLSYLDGLERIFTLDPEFILARINDPAIMGTIARLSDEDKKRYLIEVDSNLD
jgi:hypothetical protein